MDAIFIFIFHLRIPKYNQLKMFLRKTHVNIICLCVMYWSSDPFYLVTYYLKWLTTSWTDSNTLFSLIRETRVFYHKVWKIKINIGYLNSTKQCCGSPFFSITRIQTRRFESVEYYVNLEPGSKCLGIFVILPNYYYMSKK